MTNHKWKIVRNVWDGIALFRLWAGSPCNRGSTALDELVDLGLHKNAEQPLLALSRFYFRFDYLQCPIGSHGPLIWTVACSKGIEDIGDAHHARLNRDLGQAEMIGVPRAVQPFV